MSKERELLERSVRIIEDYEAYNLIDKIEELLAQPEQTEPVEICPDCGSKVTWYHCREGTRVVCGDRSEERRVGKEC